jgi:hypothetical protein
VELPKRAAAGIRLTFFSGLSGPRIAPFGKFY